MLSKPAYPLLIIVFLSVLMPAQAGEGLEKLRTFTRDLQTMTADFKQTLFDDKMRQIEVSNGRFALLKPGRFRWDYKVPYEQQIIADGEKLWLYDPELDQVTVQPLKNALGTAPIALLTSDTDLEKQFKIIELGEIDGREMLQLEIKIKDTDYGFMLLALGQDGLEVMELKDRLGQVVRIEFLNTAMNSKIASEHFDFTVPEGVDVVGQ